MRIWQRKGLGEVEGGRDDSRLVVAQGGGEGDGLVELKNDGHCVT